MWHENHQGKSTNRQSGEIWPFNGYFYFLKRSTRLFYFFNAPVSSKLIVSNRKNVIFLLYKGS